jgi:hypothetical protein
MYMTDLLEKALQRVRSLPTEQQDAIASEILESLDDEKQWTDKFASSRDRIRQMAQEALAQDARGEPRPLNDLLD